MLYNILTNPYFLTTKISDYRQVFLVFFYFYQPKRVDIIVCLVSFLDQ